MSSLSNFLKHKSSGPYPSGLKVKVVARKEEIKYKSKDGKEKALIVVAVSDGDEVVKCVIYDASQFQKFKVGNTLILRNVIRKIEELVSVVVTSASKVFISSTLQVPEDHAARGGAIINPLPAPTTSIKVALGSPPKKRVSVKGKITQEEETRKVMVRGEEVSIKNISVCDETGTSNVTLWRDISSTECRPGDHVILTDMVVNHYNNVVSLQTTTPSKITKIETPEETKHVTVEAIGMANDSAELLTLQGDSVTVPGELLQLAIPEFEKVIAEGPIELEIVSKGSEVLSIEKM